MHNKGLQPVTGSEEEHTILFSMTDGLAELTLNRPARLNSFTQEMHLELRSFIDDLSANPDCRCLLLTGAGRAFCTGQDLNDRDPRKRSGPPDLEATLTTLFNPLVTRIRSLEMPVVCAVNGVAAGAGANLALACDLVLAAKSARFIQSFAHVGLLPDAGGTWILPRLIGEARAKAIAITGTPVNAEEAKDWGMIWAVHDDNTLMQEARSLANQLAKGPTLGLGKTKMAIQTAYNQTFEDHLELEAKNQGQLGRSADYAEGVLAFLEKRKARFTGA